MPANALDRSQGAVPSPGGVDSCPVCLGEGPPHGIELKFLKMAISWEPQLRSGEELVGVFTVPGNPWAGGQVTPSTPGSASQSSQPTPTRSCWSPPLEVEFRGQAPRSLMDPARDIGGAE